MKKRILSLAVVMIFSIVSILGCFNVFAAGNPSITPPSDYAVKTSLIADDFEDRTVDGTIADGSSYSAPVTAELSIGVVSAETNGNKYITTPGTKSDGKGAYEKYFVDSSDYFVNSDKLGISMDVMNPAALTTYTKDTTTVSVIYVGGKPLFKLNMNEKSAAQGLELKYYYNDGKSNKEGSFKNASGSVLYTQKRGTSVWNHIDIVLRREINDDSTAYDVVLEKLNVNGNEFYTGDSAFTYTPNFKSVDWWTQKTTRKDFIYFGNSTSTWAMDNVLIYVPKGGEEEEENVTTKVTKPSYLPEVGTLVLDESFEESYLNDAQTLVNSDYAYSNFNNYTKNDASDAHTYGLMTDNTKYVVFQAYNRVKSKITGAVNSDKLALTFDFMPPSGATGKGFNIYFDGVSSAITLRLGFTAITGDTKNYNMYLSSTSEASGSVLSSSSNITVPIGEFTKFSCVLQKVNVNGTDKAILSEAYLNDTKLDLADDIATRYLAGSWFTATTNPSVGVGNFGVAGFGLDNILAYAPVEFTANNIEVNESNDGAEITFSDNVSDITTAAVTATSAVGEVINSTLSVSGKTVTAAFASPLDANKVYTISVTGVKDAGGVIAPAFTKVVGTGFASFSDIADATLTIRNGKNTVMEGKLILAAYDASGNLISVSANTDVSVPVDITRSFTYTIPTIPEGKTAASGKFFVWDNLSDVTPLIQSVEFRLN